MKIAIILSAVDKASRVINSTVGKIQKGLNKFGNYATIAGAAGTLFFGQAIKSAEESEVATNRLQRVFKSMGQDYVVATKNAAAYASALQTQIGFEDEAIMAVQAKLATFEKASNAAARANDIFNRATLAAFDMQQTGFGDAENNIVQLGKALQDPITGINALRRSGITFTEAEKKKIAMLVKSNQTFKAQNMIMKAIEKQVGGVAKSTVTSSQRMRIAWGEVMERLGNAVLPLFEKFANFILDKVIPVVQKFVDEHPVLVKWLAIASVSLLALGAASKVVSFAISGVQGVFSVLMPVLKFAGKTFLWLGRIMLANPILIVIAAIAVGVYLIIKHWSKIKAFFTRLWSGVKAVFKSALKVVLGVTLFPIRVIMAMWQKISAFFSGLWSSVRSFAADVWNAIGNAITAPIDWIKEKWQALTDWFTKTWGKIKGFFSNLWKGAKQVMSDVVTAPVRAVERLTGNNAIIEANMKKTAQTVDDYLPHSPAKKGPLRNIQKVKIMESIAASINPQPLVSAMRGSLNTAFNRPVASPIAAGAGGGSVVLNYNPTITMAGSNSNIKQLLRDHAMEIKKMIDEVNRKKDRTRF